MNITIGFDERQGHSFYNTTTEPLKKEMIRRGYKVEVYSAFNNSNIKPFDVIVTNYMAVNTGAYKAPITVYLPHGVGLWKSGTQISIPTDFFMPSDMMRFWFESERSDKKYHVVGYPRLDSLLNKMKNRQEIRNRIIRELKLDASKPIIVYLPTFNSPGSDNNKRGTSTELEKIDVKQIPNFVISMHGFDLSKHRIRELERRFKYSYWQPNKEDLMLSADMVVGDISGLLIESLVLNIPIIHLSRGSYDMFEMFNRGGNYGLLILGDVTTAENLVQTIQSNLKFDKFAALRAYWKPKLIHTPQGGATKLAADTLERLIKEKFNVK